MGLEALLAKLERQAAVTHGTPRYADGVPPRPAPGKACTPGTPGTPKKDNAGSIAGELAATDALPNVGMEARRQRVVEILAANPGFKYAVVTDSDAEPGVVVVHVGVRDFGSGEIVIAKTAYDGIALLALLKRFSNASLRRNSCTNFCIASQKRPRDCPPRRMPISS
jgi:hypothetical protein